MARASTRGKRATDSNLIERRCRCKVGRKGDPCMFVIRRIDHPDGLCFTCRMGQKRDCYQH
jgi:hypothetical protein